jgi:RHS repeat-associated protein
MLALLALLCSTGAKAQNNAAFVSQSVPTSMLTGTTYNVTVAMSNTGGTIWTAANSLFLGSQNPENNSTWGGGRVAMPASVGPGGQANFAFQIIAPRAPGTYNFQWRMLQEGVEWFGAFTPNVAVTVSAAPPHNDAQVIGVSVPPVMTQGQGYTIAVTLKNSGNTTWPAGSAYALGSTIPQNTMLWGVNRVALNSPVPPGQQTTLSFQVTAPAAGSYSMGWGMVQENVEWFGATSSSAVTVNPPASGAVVTYIHTDGLGSPVARTDGAGQLISRTRYEPYGLTAGGATPTIGFTGHLNDADTGLVYMQQRYYDPVAGRFLSIDPVTTDEEAGEGFNRYSYAINNPYGYVDPDGRDAEAIVVEIKGKREPKSPPAPSVQREPKVYLVLRVPPPKAINDPPLQGVHPECVLPGIRFLCEGATIGGGVGLAIKGGGGIRRKPGSLGQPKGTDALRRENEQARAVDKELGLAPGTTHKATSNNRTLP